MIPNTNRTNLRNWGASKFSQAVLILIMDCGVEYRGPCPLSGENLRLAVASPGLPEGQYHESDAAKRRQLLREVTAPRAVAGHTTSVKS